MASVDFDFIRFILISGITLISILFGNLILKTSVARLFVVIFNLGTFLYSGVGFFSYNIPFDYINYYSIFVIVANLFFVLVLKSKIFVMSTRTVNGFDKIWHSIINYRVYIIIGVMVLQLFLLVYPENNLSRLINPPRLDLTSSFRARFDGGQSAIVYFLDLIKNIIMPVLLIAVFSYRKVPLYQFIILLGFFYLEFCQDAYIGRFTIVLYSLLLFLFYWFGGVLKKKYILITLFSGGLFFVATYSAFETYRLGRDLQNFDLIDQFDDSLDRLIEAEFSYPTYYDSVMSVEGSADLKRYYLWIATLPIPKFLIGSSVSYKLNDEISSRILGVNPGDYNFYIILIANVLESVYIYGKNYFWVHAVFIGILMGISYNILRNSNYAFPYLIYICLQFAVMSRGGIASIISILINQSLLIFLILILVILYNRNNQKNENYELKRKV